MDTAKPPIFVLGCQRSGTSLLRRILDSHSNIACPPESAFIVQLSRVYEIKRALEGLTNMGFTDSDVLEQMGAFTSHFFETFAEAQDKPRWADKTTYYVNHADTIDLMFGGQVQYVGVVRNGMDVAHSLSGFDWGVLKPYLTEGVEKPVAAARFWGDQNAKLFSFSQKVHSRFHLVRYEELTADPEPVLRKLFEYLDEPWEAGVLDFNSHEHISGFEDPKIANYEKIEVNSGNYRNWPVDLQQRVYSEARPWLEKLGYSLELR